MGFSLASLVFAGVMALSPQRGETHQIGIKIDASACTQKKPEKRAKCLDRTMKGVKEAMGAIPPVDLFAMASVGVTVEISNFKDNIPAGAIEYVESLFAVCDERPGLCPSESIQFYLDKIPETCDNGGCSFDRAIFVDNNNFSDARARNVIHELAHIYFSRAPKLYEELDFDRHAEGVAREFNGWLGAFRVIPNSAPQPPSARRSSLYSDIPKIRQNRDFIDWEHLSYASEEFFVDWYTCKLRPSVGCDAYVFCNSCDGFVDEFREILEGKYGAFSSDTNTFNSENN